MNSITLCARTMIELKQKLKGVELIGGEVIEMSLYGAFSDETDAEFLDNKQAVNYCFKNGISKDSEHFDDYHSTHGELLSTIGSIWLTTNRGEKIRFPRKPENCSYKDEAKIFIKVQMS